MNYVRERGAMAAQLIPNQQVARSNRNALTLPRWAQLDRAQDF